MCQICQGFFRSQTKKKPKRNVKKHVFFDADAKGVQFLKVPSPQTVGVFIHPTGQPPPWEVGTEALSSLGSRGIEALSASKQQAVQAAQAVTHSMLGNLTGQKFSPKSLCLLFCCVYIICV